MEAFQGLNRDMFNLSINRWKYLLMIILRKDLTLLEKPLMDMRS
jgi:hypothetical protein